MTPAELEATPALMTGTVPHPTARITWAAWQLPDGRVMTRTHVRTRSGSEGVERLMWADMAAFLSAADVEVV